MKLILATLLSFFCLFASADEAIPEPQKLTCQAYSNIQFVPEAPGSKLDASENITNIVSEDDLIYLNFAKNRLHYTVDQGFTEESLKLIAPRVYLATGRDDNGSYHGVYTFSPDYVLASYSIEGDYTEFFICDETTPNEQLR